MIEIYKKFWKNYVNFSGVASRKEYWITQLINFILYFVVYFAFAAIGAALMNVNENLGAAVASIGIIGFGLAIIIPSISIAVRRFHDVNHTGWWVLLSLLPILNIVAFVFTVLPSEHNNNKWVGTYNDAGSGFDGADATGYQFENTEAVTETIDNAAGEDSREQ